MLGWLNWRTYLIVAFFTAVTTGFLVWAFGDSLGVAIRQIGNNAYFAGVPGALIRIIVEPFFIVLENPIVGSIAVGLFWPIALIWLFLMVMVMVFSIFGRGVDTFRQNAPLFDY